jgi:catechol 2,3-dioxygenase-like lactoylglutathione lyase family enzyme
MSLSSIRHIDIVVSSLDTSLKFYRELLGPLGWKQENEIEGERGERLVYLAGPAGFSDGAIGLRERQSQDRQIPYDRYDLGLHHIAINAESKKQVDERANWLQENGHQVEDGPHYFYNDHYYALFFYDFDGIKLEIVCGSEGNLGNS